MKPNPEALQQWAKQVFDSEYFTYVIGQTRLAAIEELTEAVRECDKEKTHLCAVKLIVLEDVATMLSSLSIDLNFKREFHEVLEDNAD